MSLYRAFIEPRLVDFACGLRPIARQREKIVPLARGRVLEVGFGGGRNLPFYDPAKVTQVIGLEPSPAMRALAGPRIAASRLPVSLIGLRGEEIPLDAASVDTAVVTYTLCTIPDVATALAGLHRVLKPSGRLIFCEHGLAPDAGVARWQNRLDRPWRALAGGCRLNRDILALIAQGGFSVGPVQSGYLPRTPRFVGYQFWGEARPT